MSITSFFADVKGVPAKVLDVVQDAAFALGKLPQLVTQLKRIVPAAHQIADAAEEIIKILEEKREDQKRLEEQEKPGG